MTSDTCVPSQGTQLSRRYRYETSCPTYSLSWAPRADPRFRFAIGSCLEQERNSIQVLELNEERKRIEMVAEAEVTLPATKLMWRPTEDPNRTKSKDLLASASTTLNLWKLEDGQIDSLADLSHARGNQENQPPITSFDWSVVSDHKICVSAVDTTCTIWNIERQKIEAQLIAHDKAVYDVVFSQIGSMFATVGADGSLRLFDQRHLEQSTIVYESVSAGPLLRLAWNRINTNLIAIIGMHTPGVSVIDIRRPCVAMAELTHGNAYASHLTWAPHSRYHLLCGCDSGQALIWNVRDSSGQNKPRDASASPSPTRDASPSSTTAKSTPVLAHSCDHEVYQVQWPASQPDHIALGTAAMLDILQV